MIYRRRRILLSEIDRQCRFAMIAYGDASSALERRDAERCWYSLQGLIAAAGQIHRLLWPAGATEDWSEELRCALEVSDDSPLNQSELDSALDITPAVQSLSSTRANHAPLSSRPSFAGLADSSPAECVRCFDPESGVFTLFGKLIELPSLLNAIAELSRKAEVEQQHLREVV